MSWSYRRRERKDSERESGCVKKGQSWTYSQGINSPSSRSWLVVSWRGGLRSSSPYSTLTALLFCGLWHTKKKTRIPPHTWNSRRPPAKAAEASRGRKVKAQGASWVVNWVSVSRASCRLAGYPRLDAYLSLVSVFQFKWANRKKRNIAITFSVFCTVKEKSSIVYQLHHQPKSFGRKETSENNAHRQQKRNNMEKTGGKRLLNFHMAPGVSFSSHFPLIKSELPHRFVAFTGGRQVQCPTERTFYWTSPIKKSHVIHSFSWNALSDRLRRQLEKKFGKNESSHSVMGVAQD